MMQYFWQFISNCRTVLKSGVGWMIHLLAALIHFRSRWRVRPAKTLHNMGLWACFLAIVPILAPQGLQADEATRTQICVTLQEAEMKAKDCRTEFAIIRDDLEVVYANCRQITSLTAETRALIDDLSKGNAEAKAKMEAWICSVNAAAADGKFLLCEIKQLQCELKELNCYLQQLNCNLASLNCQLCGLADKIYAAKLRAFIFGVLVGVGISAAFTGGCGAVPGVASVPIW